MSRRFILLTGTVVPHNVGRLAVAEPEERVKQYSWALARWTDLAGKIDSHVILADNSPSWVDVKSLPESAGAEIIRLPTNQTGIVQKGRLEGRLIDAAIEFLDPDSRDIIVKCTGRLFVSNAGRLLANVRGEGLWARATVDMSYADSRFFAFSAGAWRSDVRGMGEEVDEERGIFLEHVLGRRLLLARGEGRTVSRFRGRPLFEGVSGTMGVKYGGAKQLVRAAVTYPVERWLRAAEGRKQY